jgi:hypothetical protein
VWSQEVIELPLCLSSLPRTVIVGRLASYPVGFPASNGQHIWDMHQVDRALAALGSVGRTLDSRAMTATLPAIRMCSPANPLGPKKTSW